MIAGIVVLDVWESNMTCEVSVEVRTPAGDIFVTTQSGENPTRETISGRMTVENCTYLDTAQHLLALFFGELARTWTLRTSRVGKIVDEAGIRVETYCCSVKLTSEQYACVQETFERTATLTLVPYRELLEEHAEAVKAA